MESPDELKITFDLASDSYYLLLAQGGVNSQGDFSGEA